MTIETIGVIGAGTMGNGIAQAFAMSGFPVVMQDLSEEALARGRAAQRFADDGYSPRHFISPCAESRRPLNSEQRGTDWPDRG